MASISSVERRSYKNEEMKKTIFCICAVVFALCSFATPQEVNVIYIDGEAWMMSTEPLLEDSALFNRMKASLPKDRLIKSSNWDGYASYWSIKQKRLHLDSIQFQFLNRETNQYRKECFSESKMKSLFKGYVGKKGVVATWFTGTLSAVRGNIIRGIHLGHESIYDHEIFLTIKKGRVTKREDYHNKVIDGYSCDSGDMEKNHNKDELMAMLRVHHENYPELAQVKRILFIFKNIGLDSSGHITDCTVTAQVNKGDKWEVHPGIAEEMKKALMAIYPWKTLYLRGKYVPYALEGFALPYQLDD